LAENRRSELELEWQGQLSDLVTDLAWSPTGLSWAASSADGAIVWLKLNPVNLAAQAPPSQILLLQPANGQSIDCLAFSADGRWLATGGQSGQLSIWNCQQGNLLPQLVITLELQTWIERLAWHPTLPQLAIGYGPQVKIWDVVTATEITTWRFKKSSVFDLAWHPSGAYLAIAGYKGVEIWEAADDRFALSQTLIVEPASIHINWSPDGRYLAAANLDRRLTIMDWHNPDDPWILQGCPGKIHQLTWIEHTGNPCLAVATGKAVVLWELEAENWTGQLLEGHQGVVEAIAACPDRPMLLSAATDGNACLWSAQGEISQIITKSEAAVPVQGGVSLPNALGGFTALAWHPHSTYLVMGNQIGGIELWKSSA
jgi:WD40 repeat protein